METGHHFLPIGEAAKLLGMSRIRLREAIAKGLLPARRDNEGYLRVDLTSIPDDLEQRLGDLAMKPAELLDTLFDEIEELQAHLAERDAHVARLSDLVQRQDDALERSLKALGNSIENRPSETGDSSLERISERAFSLLGEATDRLEENLRSNMKFRDLIEHSLSLSEAAEAASGARAAELSATADRAMALLDRALKEGEVKGAAADHLRGLLDRALDAGQRLEAEAQVQNEKAQRQEKIVERMLGMSERALDVASSARPRKRRWLGWLTGR